MCSLESAIGEYSIEVVDNGIQVQNLEMPTVVALSNNTQVNRTADVVSGYHRSTLGGISYMVSQLQRAILEC